MGAYETLQYLGNYDLERTRAALGNVRIQHGGAMYEFYKLDSDRGQRMLNLKFKSLMQYGNLIDAGDAYGGLQTPFDYIDGFFDRNCIQSIKPFVVVGPEDTIARFYFFADDQMSSNLFTVRMWSSGVKLLQIYLPGVTGPDDPLSMPNPLAI